MGELLELRPAVAAMAQVMEAQLRRHDATRGPAGWEEDDVLDLFAHLVEEVCEVGALLDVAEEEIVDLTRRACDNLPPEAYHPTDEIEALRREGGDVCNMLMMILHVEGALGGDDGTDQ